MTRRELLALAAASVPLAGAAPLLIDAHIHLFEPAKFPYHPSATYKPPAEPLEPYLAFAKSAGISHAILVHPEPYQDDHAYLWHCLQNESPKGFFKGTLLLDPTDPKTPARMKEMVKAHPGRLATVRIHAMNAPGVAPLRSGAIKNRDLRDPQIGKVFEEAADLDLAVQFHFLPHHADEINALCAKYPKTRVVLDHMGRVGMGKPEDQPKVMALGRHPQTYFKYSGWSYFENPAIRVEQILPQAVKAFGTDRIVWGGLGMNAAEHAKAKALFAKHWSFLPAAEQAKIQGANAARLYRFAS